MKNLNKLLIASAIAFASTGANAALISMDWKVSGDSLSTLDESTGIEWLDLTQTDNMSMLAVENQLTANGNFEGWRVATRSEVSEMLNNHFTEYDFEIFGGSKRYTSATSDNQLDTFRGLFGYTANQSSFTISYGMFRNTEGMNGNDIMYSGGYDTKSNNTGYFYSNQGISDENYSHDHYGTYLVSDGGVTLSSINNPELNVNNPSAPINSVPLPATLGLLSLGLAGFTRRKKRK